MKTAEQSLIEEYFEAFNRHDIEGVIGCFHDDVVIVGAGGERVEGLDAVRRRYEGEFRSVPDGRCDLQSATCQAGRGVAESVFHGTTLRRGGSVRAVGAEIIEFADGKIREIRDYHRIVEGA
jgi:taurine dehydrogenase small subunit